MSDTGHKILEGLKDAVAGNFAAVTIEGQRWVLGPQWQPIESAPRDKFVLLLVPNGQLESGPVTMGMYWKAEDRAANGRFAKGAFVPADWAGWLGTDADHSASWCDPTHWRPLPDASVQQ